MEYITKLKMSDVANLHIYFQTDRGTILDFNPIVPIRDVEDAPSLWGCKSSYAVIDAENDDSIFLTTKDGWPSKVLEELSKNRPDEVCSYAYMLDNGERCILRSFGEMKNGRVLHEQAFTSMFVDRGEEAEKIFGELFTGNDDDLAKDFGYEVE